MLLTSLIFVAFIEELHTLHGERLPAILIFRHGRRSCDATCQVTREGGAIIDICIVVFAVFCSISLVPLHARVS